MKPSTRKRRKITDPDLTLLLPELRGYSGYYDWYDNTDRKKYNQIRHAGQLGMVKSFFEGMKYSAADTSLPVEQKLVKVKMPWYRRFLRKLSRIFSFTRK